jgi:hypothetical protein
MALRWLLLRAGTLADDERQRRSVVQPRVLAPHPLATIERPFYPRDAHHRAVLTHSLKTERQPSVESI